MSTIVDQGAIITRLIADYNQYSQDVTAKLAALAANSTDPATAAGINDAVTKLTALDQLVKTADVALQAQTATTSSATVTATPAGSQ